MSHRFTRHATPLCPNPLTAPGRWQRLQLAREMIRLESEARNLAREAVALALYRVNRGDALELEEAL